MKVSIKALKAAELLPLIRRAPDAHKGHFGHVLIVGGDEGMCGAALLAGLFAARTGAGKVTVAVHPSHVASIIAYQPTLMAVGVKRPRDLSQLLQGVDVVVLGPGMGRSRWSERLCQFFLQQSLPLIVDAGAFYFLHALGLRRDDWVLTPHVGEAALLLDVKALEIQNDRLTAVHALQKKYGGVVILKGSGSLIADAHDVFICEAGNPGMASGGMGDALNGIIAGLMAQHYSLLKAAQTAVLVHALAADQVVQDAGMIGLLATDLIPALRRLLNFG